MENPFSEIIERLIRIENHVSILQPLQPIKQLPVGTKVEQPITQNEAVKFLDKSRMTLITWRKKGLIQAYRIGGRIYYKPSELLAAMEKLGK